MIAHSAQGSSSGSTAPSALWSARHEQQQRRRQQQQDPAHSSATTTTTAGGSSSSSSSRPGEASPPQDVASMKAEIAELQSDTTATLDRAIAAAQATVGVGNHVSTELLEQRERMGDIDAEARDIDDNLKRTGYNLKHGFTWRGALTSPFRKASKKPAGAAAPGTRQRDIAPVFKDDYQQQQQDSNNKTKNKKSGAAAPAHGGATIDSKGKKERTGLFGSSSNKKGAGAGGAGVEAGGGRSGGEGPKLPEHVPEGFDKQLDDLDGLLDGLSAQANAIGAELRQQNDGIEAMGERVEPLRVETASQAQQIKRRFRVRG